ncbi:MAG: ABC transporter ATP-binding protein [Cyanobacteria bacterium]|nr:ABC transporter ATP-binding protein [Cyanobacteriota bacterium]MDW8200508.1 ABC transporter ATP-binding protein [Cyanobacteriota bacterium SKYGB_h_bin112]
MATPLLTIHDLCVSYGGIQALQTINLVVNLGEVVTLIGANGAGKSTVLRSISQVVKPVSGSIQYDGVELTRYRPDQVVAMGIAHCPEGRRILAKQTVLDNLILGAYCHYSSNPFVLDKRIQADIEQQWQRFPRLAERRHQLAGTLSGGEQQMLAIARALMSRPKLLLLDEPSLGLAPAIIKEIFVTIQALRDSGVTLLLVEQNAQLALQIADHGYVLEAGSLTLEGTGANLLTNDRVKQAYLG